MHPNDGQLRAFLDHEFADSESIAAHLASCSNCRARADEIAVQTDQVHTHFAALVPLSSHVSAQVALSRFQNQRLTRKEISILKKIFNRRYRTAWAMAALVAFFAVSLSFPPVRAWAQDVLAQFRVSKISVVSIDATRFQQLIGGTDLNKQITQLLSDSMTVTQQPGKPQAATNAERASQMAGFTVRLVTGRSDTPQLTVQDSAAFQFTVNRARAQGLLNDAGASNILLPSSIDGAVIKVKIPASFTAGYGECPNLTEGEDALKGSPGRIMLNCIILTEVPSPTVYAPPELDVAQLAELGLQFTGMTKEQAHSYAQTVDWTSTLVVPIPRNAAQYKQVNVDGVTGYMIQRPIDDAPQFTIVWVKGGIIYAIGGVGSNTDTALAMANYLK